MNDYTYFSILLNRHHLLHPLAFLPDEESFKSEKQSDFLKISRRVAVVALAVLTTASSLKWGYPLIFGVTGVSVFYTASAFLKYREIQSKCQRVWNKNSSVQEKKTSNGQSIKEKLEEKSPFSLKKEGEILKEDSLNRENLVNLVSLEIEKLKKHFEQSQMFIELDESVKQFLVNEGLALRETHLLLRTIKKNVQDPLAEKMLLHRKGFRCQITMENGKIILIDKEIFPINQMDQKKQDDPLPSSDLLPGKTLTPTSDDSKLKDQVNPALSLASKKASTEITSNGEIILIDKEIFPISQLDQKKQDDPLPSSDLLPGKTLTPTSDDSKLKDQVDPALSLASKQVSPTIPPVSEVKKLASEKELNNILVEIITTEKAFLENAQQIFIIFEELHNFYPEEKLMGQYKMTLEKSLPSFKRFYENLNLIQTDQNLKIEKKAELIAVHYSHSSTADYYKSLSDLTLLYGIFHQWDNKVQDSDGFKSQYEKLTNKSHLFSLSILQQICARYSPAIFMQRLPRHEMLIEQITKQLDHSLIKQTLLEIKIKINEINERKQKQDAVQEIYAQLNANLSGKQLKQAQKKAMQIFIENRLFADSAYTSLNQEIKNLSPLLFKKILSNLFLRIEEFKLDPKKNSSKQQEKLKNDLKNYLEYEKEFSISDIDLWKQIAQNILAQDALTCSMLNSYVDKNITYTFIKLLFSLVKVKVEKEDSLRENLKILTLIQNKLSKKLDTLKVDKQSNQIKKLNKVFTKIEELKNKILISLLKIENENPLFQN